MFIKRQTKGIHPIDHKQEKEIIWRESCIESMPAPSRVYISLAQHIGKPAIACVEKGQYVKLGEIIATADGPVSANIHSSVSGVVCDIISHPNLNGVNVPTIVVDNDNQYSYADFFPVNNINAENIIKASRENGLVGMGGATFPTHVKLSTKDKIDTVIINGAECEPYLTTDDRLMREHPDQIVGGAILIKQALNADRVIIAIEGNKPQAIDAIKQHATQNDVEVFVLPKRYPMGAEKQLVFKVTKRVIKSGMLPSSEGCVVQNVATANALYEAVYLGRPVTSRVITVAGSAFKKGKNLLVPIGTRICDILDYVGVEIGKINKIISGGPMMGQAVSNIEASTTKGTSGLLLLDESGAELPSETPCIRCGRCADACPMSLQPLRIDAAQRKGLESEFFALRAYDCIECGSCTFVCPAKRYIVQSVRLAKSRALAMKREGIK